MIIAILLDNLSFWRRLESRQGGSHERFFIETMLVFTWPGYQPSLV